MKVNPTLSLEVQKTKFEVTVTGDGEFWTEHEGDSLRSTTFKGLRAKLVETLKGERKRIELPLSKVTHGGEVAEVVFLGLHANGNYLVRDSKGNIGQERLSDGGGYGDSYGDKYLPILDGEQKAELQSLRAAVKLAEETLKKWITSRRVSVPNLVKAALR